MYEELEDPRRKWLQDMPPSVLERVSKQPQGRRRTWLARGDVKAASHSRRAKLLEEANRPMEMRRQFMQDQMPLGDREKMQAGFQQQNLIQQRGQQFTAGQGELDFQRQKIMGGITNQNRMAAAEQGNQWDVQAAATAVENRPPQQGPTPIPIRAPDGATSWATPGETPLPQDASRMPTYQEPQTPTISEQEDKILAQLDPLTPEWWQMRQRIEEIKSSPVDPIEQMLALQRLARGSRELGWGGAMGEEMPEQAGVGAFAQQGLSDLMGQGQQQQGQYQIGQIITNPQGQQGKVVGFNPDGTPLIEPL